jgi:hypothetical protein
MRKLRACGRLRVPLSDLLLICWFAGGLAGMVIIIRLLLKKFLEFSAGLTDQGGGKAAGGFLALSGQIFHSHIEQGNIFLEPAQSFLYPRNAEIVG